ncbi:MAG: VWA domain-containing protein [Hyphomicrobium sp.]|nr:VWA domain-containing protein [Hyphomicrobium sp.]
MAIFLFGIIGAALDFGKWHNASQHAEAAMDSALLAAGRQLQTEPDEPGKALDMANLYFNQEMADGVKVTGAVAEFKIVDDGMGIDGKVVGNVKTPFLGLLNIRNLTVNRTAKVAFSTGGGSGNDIEVALMLDVTGSMCADNIGPCTTSLKLDALKSAAKDLVNIVVVNGEHTRVAVVPFSTRVRLGLGNTADGAALMKKVTNLDPTWTGWNEDCQTSSGSGGSEGNGNWTCSLWVPKHFANLPVMPCVSERTGMAEFTDAGPGSNTWANAHDGTRRPSFLDSSDVPMATGRGGTAADVAGQWNYEATGWCSDIAEPNSVLPLNSDAGLISARIDALEAYGSTAGALGTAWTWYMLSPNWSSVFPATAAPGPYSDTIPVTAGAKPKLRKIAVLMTDGDYNTYLTDKLADPQDVSNRAKQLCTNMKAQGIEIFTVGFELDQLPAAKKAMAIDTLQSCGSTINHFYNSLDPVAIDGFVPRYRSQIVGTLRRSISGALPHN